MKSLFLCGAFCGSLFVACAFAKPLPAESEQTATMGKYCGGQIASLVQTAHQMKDESWKKVIFSQKIDDQFLELFQKIKTLAGEVPSGEAPGKKLVDQINQVSDDMSNLAKKSSPHEFDLCVQYMMAEIKEISAACPEILAKTPSKEESERCTALANKAPAVSTKMKNWQDAYVALKTPGK